MSVASGGGTEDAAFSRRMLALTRSQQPSPQADEARGFLQKRLEVYARVVFWAFVALRVLELLLYWGYPDVKPHAGHYPYIVALGVAGLAVMATCWRGLLVRRTLSLRALALVDATYTLSAGLVFAGTAVLATDRREVGYVCLVYTCFVVFMRALVVPSTGRFTLFSSLLALGPVVIAALVLALTTEQELPAPAFFCGALTFAGFAVAIASAGSRLIYGLRKRVDEQMRLGQYTLEAKLGEGRMGTVYRARHLLLRPTAVKLLRPDVVGAETLLRFEREVQRMSQLTHPNTVAIFDYGHSHDGIFYYEMEYLDGIDLDDLVAIDGPQPAGRVIRILEQVCGSLHEAHERGIVHRNLEPGNIMLCRRGGMPDVVKVLDFGLAPQLADATTATDILAIGRIAQRLLCDGAIPPALAAIIDRCVAEDAARRPATVGALVDELHALGLASTWADDDAKAWWDAREATPSARSSMPAMTIAIELAERVSEASL